MHGQNHEEQAWLQAIRFLIFPLLFSTNFASEVPGVSWNTPTSDDIYVPGDTISVSWKSSKAIPSPSFMLCVDDGNGDDGEQCGEPVWPTVLTDQSTYSITIIAPNVTDQDSFYLRMKSDLGDTFSSPEFELAASILELDAEGINGLETSSIAMPSATPQATLIMSSLSPIVTASVTESTPGSRPQSSLRKSPDPLAIGVPIAMVGVLGLGACAFLLSRRRRKATKASVPAGGLSQVPKPDGSQRSLSEHGSQSQLGDKNFFNISLNKTKDDLSAVEKAVIETISSCATSGDRHPLSRSGGSRPNRSPTQVRHQGDEEQFTKPPPRMRRKGDISDREFKGLHRGQMPPRQRCSCGRSSSSDNLGVDYWEQCRKREPCRPLTHEGHAAFCEPRYYEGADHTRPHIPPQLHDDQDWYRDTILPPWQERSQSSPNPATHYLHAPAVRVQRAETNPLPLHYNPNLPVAQTASDHNATLSVISAYFTPSPHIASSAGFPSSPYLIPQGPPYENRENPRSISMHYTLPSGGDRQKTHDSTSYLPIPIQISAQTRPENSNDPYIYRTGSIPRFPYANISSYSKSIEKALPPPPAG